jgi:hypothetical protein
LSAGHGHRRANEKHHTELADLKQEGGYPELWKRWRDLKVDYDIPDLAGYNVAGTERYLDQDFFKALFDPAYARQIGMGEIDTGLSPENTVVCLLEHEGEEKVLLDSDNPINSYQDAHEYSTAGEHERVRKLGGRPVQYERGLQAAIKWCEQKKPQRVPPDYACAPYVDEPDAADQRILKLLKELGVQDADRVSKKATNYQPSAGAERCDGCSMWRPDPEQAQFGLARCSAVDGLVRDHYVCDEFKPAASQPAASPPSPGTASPAQAD